MTMIATLIDTIFTPGRPRGLSADQAKAYRQLSRMSDRQLADIGITRGLIATMLRDGPQAIADLLPAGAAVLQPANQNQLRNVA